MFSSSQEQRQRRHPSSIRDLDPYLGAGGVVRQGRGDEEDEVAAGDGGLEGVGVVHVRLEQPQPLRRAGERPEQPRLLLVRCTYVNETKQAHEGRSSDDMHGRKGSQRCGDAAWIIEIRYRGSAGWRGRRSLCRGAS